MRRIQFLLGLAMLLLGSAVAAQPNPDQDQICLWFEETDGNCRQAEPFVNVTALVVLENISEPSGISGWACSIEIGDDPTSFFVLGWTCVAGNPCGVGPPPDFAVGIGEPIPWAPRILLLQIDLLLLSPAPIDFWIHEYQLSPLWPWPAYAAGDDPSRVVRLFNCTGYDSEGHPNPAGCLNCACEEVIGIESRSWGTLKSLYR
jgi:hypothetical protein